MGEEWIRKVQTLLTAAGISCREEFPAEPTPAVTAPVAALGLRDLNWGNGTATVSVRVLSPRKSGGGVCQETAVRAVMALEQGGITARMETMDYRSGCDCFEIQVLGVLVIRQPEPEPKPEPEKPAPRAWSIRMGTSPLPFAVEFSEEENLDRRLIGSVCDAAPVGVTPGTGGWKLRLVQEIPAGSPEPGLDTEPMTFTVMRENRQSVYSGCYRSLSRKKFTDGVLTLEWQGFALQKKENAIG